MVTNKVALVTGASRGIGNAVAVQLAKEGYAVAAVGTSEVSAIDENLERIREWGNPFLYIRGNIALEDDRKRIVGSVLKRFDRIDMLVNNAGVAPKLRMDILETTEESIDYVLGVNLKGTFFLTQIVSNNMIKLLNTIPEFAPRIINISSISAYTSSTQRAEYCISKAAVSMITTLYADRLAEYGINVYEIRPGVINTDMTSSVKGKYEQMIQGGLTPIKRWGQPQDVANAVSVICSGKLNFSTGEVINVDGGFHIRRL